jgi:hypothetical protein
MSDVRLLHDLWWFTTPEELRQLADDMERFWRTCQPGQSKIVTKIYSGRDDSILTILVDQDRITSPGWTPEAAQRAATPGPRETEDPERKEPR